MAYTKATLPSFTSENQLIRPPEHIAFPKEDKRMRRNLPMTKKDCLNSKLVNSVCRAITILEYRAEKQSAVEWGPTLVRRLLRQDELSVKKLDRSTQMYRSWYLYASTYALKRKLLWKNDNAPLPQPNADGKYPWLSAQRYTRVASLKPFIDFPPDIKTKCTPLMKGEVQ